MNAKKILLVDDDADFVSAITAMLSKKGYEVSQAYSAEEGFRKLNDFRPDLIILDVHLETETAGFDLNRKIRMNSDFGNTPILMLTGIDTLSATNQMVDMYRQMMKEGTFDGSNVLKIRQADGSYTVDYKSETGNIYWLPLDSFVAKPVDFEFLNSEAIRLLNN